jgi:hypothetical protein
MPRRRPIRPHPLNQGLFDLRRTVLREPARCALCGSGLAKGSEALYELQGKTVRCLECPT